MIKSIKEILSTTKEVAIERVRSPLISSFVVAWIAFNWKVAFILLLSESKIEEKIQKIDDLSNIYSGLWFPLSVAVFYAAIYLLINYAIFMAHHKFEKQAEIRKAESAIEVLEVKVKQAQLEARLEQTKFNAQRRLDEEKMENEYRLERQKLDLEMKRLEMERKIAIKQRDITEQVAPADA